MSPEPATGGPAVVAVGGGHGLAATLRAVSTFTDRVTAVVSVADDGGSSGRLRELLHIMPPGDLRKCLVALAEPGSLLARAFAHRFAEEELAGHALGNLVIAGLMDAADDPVRGLDEAGRLLGVRGRVLPATTEPVVLKAESDGGPVAGQVAVSGTDHIRRVSLVPVDAVPPVAVVEALDDADLIVIGPGSLFTSVLAAIVVPGIRQAIARSTGPEGLRLQPPPPGPRDRRLRRGHAPVRPGGARCRPGCGAVRHLQPVPGGPLRPGGGDAPWGGRTGWHTTRRDWPGPCQPWSDEVGRILVT